MRNDYDAPEGEDFEEIHRSDGMRWVSLLVVVLAVSAFFSLAWYAWRTNARQAAEDGELLVVEADRSPYRVAPTDPGGMQFPHQDKEVYNTLVTGDADAETVERLLPPPEAPVTDRPATITGKRETPTTSWINKRLHPDDAAKNLLQDGDREPVTEAKTAQETAAKAPVKEPIEETAVITHEYLPPKQAVKPWLPVEPEKSEEKPAPMPSAPDPIVAQAEKFAAEKKTPIVKPVVKAVKKETPAPPPPPIGFGAEVQLAALRSRAEAESLWQKLAITHGDVLGGKTHRILVAEIPGKGTYYRLRVSAGTAAAAKALCTDLTGRGQPCMTTR